MATLRKRKGSPCWYLDWHETAGDRGRRVLCTGVRHNNAKVPPRQGVAWEILLAKEAELARRKFGLAPELTKKELDSFLSFYLDWLRTTSGDISAGTLKRYHSTFTIVRRWAENERLTFLSDVIYEHCSKFVLSRSAACSSKTVKMDCTLLGQVWNEARSRGHVQFVDNPWLKVCPRNVQSVARRALTPPEIAHLLAALPKLPEWEQFVFLCALYTGARFTSIVLLPRACLDLTSRLVTFPKEIVKEAPYVVPLHPVLEKFVRRYRGGDRTHFVPAHLRATQIKSDGALAYFKKQFDAWRAATGLFQDISFHCLRHTFITALRESGASQSESQLLAGHATAAINAAYTHVPAARLAPVLARLSY